MTQLELKKRCIGAIFQAKEVSDLWTGTQIADVIDAKINALVNGLNKQEAVDDLLSDLIKATNDAQQQYEHQEG